MARQAGSKGKSLKGKVTIFCTWDRKFEEFLGEKITWPANKQDRSGQTAKKEKGTGRSRGERGIKPAKKRRRSARGGN